MNERPSSCRIDMMAFGRLSRERRIKYVNLCEIYIVLDQLEL